MRMGRRKVLLEKIKEGKRSVKFNIIIYKHGLVEGALCWRFRFERRFRAARTGAANALITDGALRASNRISAPPTPSGEKLKALVFPFADEMEICCKL